MTVFRPLQYTAALLLGATLSVAASRAHGQGVTPPAAPPGTVPRSTDLRLADVLRRAVEQHPVIEAARARVASARGTRFTARTLPNPVFTYWSEDIRGVGGDTPLARDRETQIYGTLPLEPLFQRWPRVRQADAEVRAAEAELGAARQLVALDAAHAFYRVAAAQVAVDAANDIRARLAELVTFNEARVGEGVAAEADLIRTQLELDRVGATVTLERVELARARAELTPYLDARSGAGTGRTPLATDTSRVAIDDLAGMGGPGGGDFPALAEFVARARVGRPDLLGSRARAAAARSDVTSQRTLAIRQVGATLGTKRVAGVTSLLAGLSLPIPLFDQNRGEVQRATGERTAAEQELAWAERQAVADVEAAYEAARLLSEQAKLLRGSFLNRAEESRRIALAAYQEGAVSLLQVLDASRTLADARLTYYRTLFAQRQSLLELNAAVGADPLDRLGAPAVPSASGTSPSLPVSRPARISGDRR